MQNLSPSALYDINTTEGSKVIALSSSNGFSQLIDEQTHIKTNRTSCIDLIFNDKPALSVDSGVHSSLHPNCHHEVIYSTYSNFKKLYKKLFFHKILILTFSTPHHIND